MKEVFEAYAVDSDFRDIVDSKKFAELSIHPSGDAFRKLPLDFKNSIPFYVKENVNIERLTNVG